MRYTVRVMLRMGNSKENPEKIRRELGILYEISNMMRTTLNLNDDLVKAARQRAAETGRTLTSMLETGLRELLDRESRTERPYSLRWRTVEGGVQPGVDLSDRDSLLDRMEGR